MPVPTGTYSRKLVWQLRSTVPSSSALERIAEARPVRVLQREPFPAGRYASV
jgi:hypothetical protein